MNNLDQCDPLCIYLTLRFAVSQARLYSVTPVLTFDRPFYGKALTIVNGHRKQQLSYTENQQTLFLFPIFIDARGSRLTYNQNTGILTVILDGDTLQVYNSTIHKYLQQATYELGGAPSWSTGVKHPSPHKRSRGTSSSLQQFTQANISQLHLQFTQCSKTLGYDKGQ